MQQKELETLASKKDLLLEYSSTRDETYEEAIIEFVKKVQDLLKIFLSPNENLKNYAMVKAMMTWSYPLQRLI